MSRADSKLLCRLRSALRARRFKQKNVAPKLGYTPEHLSRLLTRASRRERVHLRSGNSLLISMYLEKLEPTTTRTMEPSCPTRPVPTSQTPK